MDKESIRQHPLTLPEQFEWDIVDIMNDEQVCGCVDVHVEWKGVGCVLG